MTDAAGEDGWTVATLKEHVESLLAERNVRDQQRYDAQTIALNAALLAAEKAVATAMTAAEKAVTKAEVAAEKRFECVSADTPVLCADLTWRPAGDLLPGDELLAFDEESPARRGRRFRKATVTVNSLERDALLLVNTPEGSVRCNHEHPWLVRRTKWSNWRWMKAADLQPGYAVIHAVDTWTVDRSWESGWLAGMYDGEGCLCLNKNGGVQLSLTQRESETADRAGLALKNRLGREAPTYRVEPGKHRHTQPFFHFIVSTRTDVMKILGSVRPPRLLAKSDGVWEGKPVGGKDRATVVTSVESVGTGVIAALSTSTKTYIAGGFAMHNSVNEFRATLADQATHLMSRAETQALLAAVDAKFTALSEKVDAVAIRVEKMASASGGLKTGWGYLVAGVGLLASLAFVALALYGAGR